MTPKGKGKAVKKAGPSLREPSEEISKDDIIGKCQVTKAEDVDGLLGGTYNSPLPIFTRYAICIWI